MPRPSSASASSAFFVPRPALSPARLCSLLLALLAHRRSKYAAKPVLAMYAVQMQLVLPFLLRSGAVVNLSALLRPFRRMYAKGVEFDAHTLLTIASF
ncbi:hypothetical protein niasHS_002812 [Heterodera schachtii]|uniref:Uncharacterized protein n=2 Tax=Heterodera TaxID=34509 RepID=A0ABD2K2I1_HETSC